jgi:hypothetical protein
VQHQAVACWALQDHMAASLLMLLSLLLLY